MKNNFLLTGTNPPQRLSAEQVAELARQVNYNTTLLRRELGLSQRTVLRHFQDAFGCGPREWLKQQRVSDAVSLLTGGYSTKQTADELGYRDRCSLFRAFRHKVQHPPRKFADRIELMTVSLSTAVGRMSESATFLSKSATPRGLQLNKAG